MSDFVRRRRWLRRCAGFLARRERERGRVPALRRRRLLCAVRMARRCSR